MLAYALTSDLFTWWTAERQAWKQTAHSVAVIQATDVGTWARIVAEEVTSQSHFGYTTMLRVRICRWTNRKSEYVEVWVDLSWR